MEQDTHSIVQKMFSIKDFSVNVTKSARGFVILSKLLLSSETETGDYIKIRVSACKTWPNLQETADLVTFTEEILNGKPYFLCSAYWKDPYRVIHLDLLSYQ